MLLGYARVSTDDQDLAIQRRALRDAGCRRLFEEKLSGAQRNRPELARLLDQVRDDDVLVVRRLDRLARSRGRCTTCPKLHAKPPPAFQARFASASSCRC